MLSAIRRRLHFSPATVIAGLALVFAMTGGAYAAKKYLITSTKQISPSVLKSLQGKAGPAGAPGAQGPAGLAGPAGSGGVGPAGPKGADGAPGAKGEAGAKGATGAAGTKGVAGATGATGLQGPTGTSGFTSVLPAGKTETGTFAGSIYNAGTGDELAIPVSFTIPLPSSGAAFVLNKQETDEGSGFGGCTGSVAEPIAPPGVFCAYTDEEVNVEFGAFPTAVISGKFEEYLPTGTVIFDRANGAGAAHLLIVGVWAVTAPTS